MQHKWFASVVTASSFEIDSLLMSKESESFTFAL
jgi:hypothetical protein